MTTGVLIGVAIVCLTGAILCFTAALIVTAMKVKAMIQMNDVLHAKWQWYWRETDGKPDCGIFAEVIPGYAYAICRCPRYLTKEQWEGYAEHICKLHNN